MQEIAANIGLWLSTTDQPLDAMLSRFCDGCIEVDSPNAPEALQAMAVRDDLMALVAGEPVDGSLFLSLTTKSAFEIPAARLFVAALAVRFNLDDPDKIETALQEAVSNAIMHGNLEIGSGFREDFAGLKQHLQLLGERLCDPHHGSRRVSLMAGWSENLLTLAVKDEGSPDETLTSQRTNRHHPRDKTGRGHAIMQAFCDTLSFHGDSNAILLEFRLACAR